MPPALERRRQKPRDAFFRFRLADKARAQAQHVRIVMLARKLRRQATAAQSRTNARMAIRRDRNPDPRTANRDAELRTPMRDSLRDKPAIIRVIDRLRAIRPQIERRETERVHLRHQHRFQREPGMVIGDGDSFIHVVTTLSPMQIDFFFCVVRDLR